MDRIFRGQGDYRAARKQLDFLGIGMLLNEIYAGRIVWNKATSASSVRTEWTTS